MPLRIAGNRQLVVQVCDFALVLIGPHSCSSKIANPTAASTYAVLASEGIAHELHPQFRIHFPRTQNHQSPHWYVGSRHQQVLGHVDSRDL